MDSIELLLDDVSEQLVRHDWDALLAAGLPSRASHTSPHNRPHITLVAAPAITADRDDRVGQGSGLPLIFGCSGILLFNAGRRGYVLARQVVCGADLLALHRRVHDVGQIDAPAGTTLPDAWVPHITLANAVPPERLADALAVLSTTMLEGQLVAMRRWDSRAKTVTALG
ncbi:2'-5' RNA ligase family protein [Arthrobacter sp. CAN_C5]|uniref:2'-5' RNA ligase family protein n=1 Tax=Arthrobacter sp. CAN_C5 TaxID=2760706 RepID=UPI001AE4F1B7|nr:2'-5' RNA ligase family protein [Arthrobacter sp. CAN_C5]MBP2214913.1 2'-5' RNA ligase [Arthrobacter sp. CAN_C5]